MNTIGHNYKEAIWNNFKHNAVNRNEESVFAALNTNVKDSENMVVLPKVEKIELTKIDDLHDKLTLIWADYKTEGIMTWRPSTNKNENAMVFSGFDFE